jgi:hypothetical protein
MFGEKLPSIQGRLDGVDKEFSDVLINDVLNRVYGRQEKLDIKPENYVRLPCCWC